MSSVYMIVFTVGLTVQILAAAAATDNCEEGAVRFDPQFMTQHEGSVQFCFNNKWHRLCGGNINRVDATIICKQLGYIGSVARTTNKTGGSDNFFVTVNLQTCSGHESAITECPNLNKTSMGSCTNNRWVKCLPATCTNGSLRLVGGASYREGRVEVCVDGRWGTVCYNEELAGTVCQQLGFGSQGAMANRIDTPLPKVTCTTTADNMRLNCGDLIEGGNITAISALTVECPGLMDNTPSVPTCSPTVIHNNNTVNNQPNDLCPSCAASNTVIGILVLLEIVTLVVCIILCIKIKKTPQQKTPQQEQQQLKQQEQEQPRVVTTVNECYSTVQSHPPPLGQPHPPPLGQPHPPPLGHTDTEEQYEIMVTSEGGIVEYDVIGQHKKTSEHTQAVQ